MFPVRFAVISDVHGNRTALEAVLADAIARGAEAVVDLGDVVYGPLDPGGTIDVLRALTIPLLRVRGNEDRVLWESSDPDPNHPSLEYTRSRLDSRQMTWLRSAPAEACDDGLRLFHGRPGCDTAYLLEVPEPGGLRPAIAAEIERALAGSEERLVLCGHSHLQRICHLPGGRLVLNPGSVGLQAFRDDQPFPHLVQNDSPHARYAMVDRSIGEPEILLLSATYDWEGAAATATRHGRSDWAAALRTGRDSR